MPGLPDLKKLSDKALLQLQKDVSKARVTAASRHRKMALEAAKMEAKKHGFSLRELVGDGGESAADGAAPKYRHPDDPSLTWTGLGRRPNWVKEAVAKGRSLEDFAI